MPPRLRSSLAWLLLGMTWVTLVASAAQTRSGDWIIRKSLEPGQVEFSLIENQHGTSSHHQSQWPLRSFSGLDISRRGHQDVHFTIYRDAGKIECEGFLNNGEGAGVFHFSPDPKYLDHMQSIGFSVDAEKQYSLAVEDVSLGFARQMKNEHLTALDAEKLLAFRIFDVNAAFIEDLRRAGLDIFDSDKLVAFRIHGVTPEMVRKLHQQGYAPDDDTLIAMRIHGATPEWIEELKQHGYDHVDLPNLIAFRIHDVSPEFIEHLQRLGYAHPKPDQLIAMRIHNVTPDYIRGLRARGMQNLTIDQLVDLRIHDIE